MSMFVNLSAIRRNALRIRKITPFFAVVKANAYGLGAVQVAHVLSDIVDGFAVANTTEAKELVENGVWQSILVLGKSEMALPYDNVVYTVSSSSDVDLLSKYGLKKFALKINTGMNRYGCAPEKVNSLVKYIKQIGDLQSVFSHLYNVDDVRACEEQLKIFERATNNVCVLKHLSASGGLLLGKRFAYDLSRVGIALYGGMDGYENVVTVTAPVFEVRKIKKGEFVGYGSLSFGRDVYVAIIGRGYADGLSKDGKAYVKINGKIYEIISVCMDVCFALVDSSVAKNSEAVFVSDNFVLLEASKLSKKSPYEILTSFGERICRNYG